MKAELDAYVEARRLSDAAKEQLERRKGVLDACERALVDAMLKDEQKSVRHTSGTLFSVTPRFFISCRLDNVAEVSEWLVGRGHERADVVREELASARVREIIKKIYEEEGKQVIPDTLKLDDAPGITVRDWAKMGEVVAS